jgi:hypothetical protein
VLNLGFLRKYRITVVVKIGPTALFVFTELRFSYRHRHSIVVCAPTCLHVIYFTATVTAIATAITTAAVCADLNSCVQY